VIPTCATSFERDAEVSAAALDADNPGPSTTGKRDWRWRFRVGGSGGMTSSKLSAGMETAKSANAEPSRESAKTASRRPARAELIWDGKYDAEGRRSAPLRVALPFQTVETVNESAQDRQRAFSFGPGFREMAQPADLGRQEIRAAKPRR